MVSTCDEFYKVIPNDSCFDIVNNHSIPLSSFYNWNPAVKNDCSGLQADEYVFVGIKTATTGTGVTTPYPIQTSMVSNCDAFYKVVAGDSCVDIANSHTILVSSFYSWNPAVNTDCSGLQANVYVCVGITSTATVTGVTTPAPIQTGMVPNCNDFYKVVTNDQCGQIASAYTIPLSSFYSWNPAVHTDCSGLQASEYVCVGVAGAASATTTGST
jgi:hypothetical protein